MVVKMLFVLSTRCTMEEIEMSFDCWQKLSPGLVDCGMFGCCFAMISGDCSDVMTVVVVEAMKVSCVKVVAEPAGNESPMSCYDSGTQS